MNTHSTSIAKDLGLRPEQVDAALNLLDAGNTIPFIARYRKEATGVLDEEQLRQVADLIEKKRALDDRRKAVIASVEAQGKMTNDLRRRFEQADTMTVLEDLYAPYKLKRRTRAMIARENGLEGLANLILNQARTRETPEQLARTYLNDKVTSIEDALAGARDIVAETISDHADVRSQTREQALRWGMLQSEKIGEDPRKVYELYYVFEMRVDKLRPHQVLAMDRGEEEKILRIRVLVAERDWRAPVSGFYRPDGRSPFAQQLELAIQDAAERLLLPAIERDVRRALTEKSGQHAIAVFAANLRALLNQPPLAGQVVLGLDPGFRTGCKLAVVDVTGKVLATGTIYPHEPQKRWDEALDTLTKLCERYRISLIAIGNGTASRESEQLAADLIRLKPGLQYLITNEAGASVYSASPLARQEMPDLDVSLRGAVSIARRTQDALAELVKIDPKSIGIGMYQHDVDQAELGRALAGVVESVVNQVGVDANTASPALLTYVSGVGPKLAEKIVAYRDENGAFTTRAGLRKVPGLGPKAFEQAAGFLRINGGTNPLDASAIHPESYLIAEAVLKKANVKAAASAEERRVGIERLRRQIPLVSLAQEFSVGEPTLVDIFDQLLRPGRDPRQNMPAPVLRKDVISLTDLAPGMILKGTVRNAIDFGAFVDIGVKQDGLLHRSQIPAGRAVQPGDVIQVEILRIEIDRGRISLGWVEDQ
jgi:uncharacterized protein